MIASCYNSCLAVLLLSALSLLGAVSTVPAPLNDGPAGIKLAAALRNSPPDRDEMLSGMLKLRGADGRRRTLPIESAVIRRGRTWDSVYKVVTTNEAHVLVVEHAADITNRYSFFSKSGTGPFNGIPVPVHRLDISFAGSDFSLADLGLEYLHWPRQVLVQNEMRKGRSCHVLESCPAVTNGYARVLSWVDVENGGVLMAEAYGPGNERMKEFEIKGFQKSGDRWLLQEMEIRDLVKGSRTIIEFGNTPKGAAPASR